MAKIFKGKITSTKMKKTIVVMVEQKYRHPKYGKVIIRHKKYKAHCEDDKFKVGETVTIAESRPISKDKHFIVVQNQKKHVTT